MIHGSNARLINCFLDRSEKASRIWKQLLQPWSHPCNSLWWDPIHHENFPVCKLHQYLICWSSSVSETHASTTCIFMSPLRLSSCSLGRQQIWMRKCTKGDRGSKKANFHILRRRTGWQHTFWFEAESPACTPSHPIRRSKKAKAEWNHMKHTVPQDLN
jgi:hypothetical protein